VVAFLAAARGAVVRADVLRAAVLVPRVAFAAGRPAAALRAGAFAARVAFGAAFATRLAAGFFAAAFGVRVAAAFARGVAAAFALRAAGAFAGFAFAFVVLAALFFVVARTAIARPRFGVGVESSLLITHAPW
jgi:hypothetical protein